MWNIELLLFSPFFAAAPHILDADALDAASLHIQTQDLVLNICNARFEVLDSMWTLEDNSGPIVTNSWNQLIINEVNTIQNQE